MSICKWWHSLHFWVNVSFKSSGSSESLCWCCAAVNVFWAAMASVVPGVTSGGNAGGVALMGFAWWCVSSGSQWDGRGYPSLSPFSHSHSPSIFLFPSLFLPRTLLWCLKGVTKTISCQRLWKEADFCVTLKSWKLSNLSQTPFNSFSKKSLDSSYVVTKRLFKCVTLPFLCTSLWNLQAISEWKLFLHHSFLNRSSHICF